MTPRTHFITRVFASPSGWGPLSLALSALLACEPTAPLADAGAVDGGTRLDAGGDAGRDAGEDAGRDAGQDAAVESQCPTMFPTSVAYTSTAAGGGSGRTELSGVTIRNIDGFEALSNVFGFNINPFPISGTSGILIGPWTEVRVIRFTVPDPFPMSSPDNPFNRRFVFMNWPNGFLESNLGYISISSCPGDLRVPTATQNGAPGDATYAEGCRNWRGNSWDSTHNSGASDLPYVIASAGNDTSTPDECRLVPGRTYYMNVYMSRPNRDTRSLLPTNEFCRDPEGTPFDCGHVINIGN